MINLRKFFKGLKILAPTDQTKNVQIILDSVGDTYVETTGNLYLNGANPSTDFVHTASNVGGEAEVFKQEVGTNLEFRTLKAGANLTITENANDITIDGATLGEPNTASNVGSGEGLFKQKVAVDLQFKSLVADSGITLTNNANDITIGVPDASASIVGKVNTSTQTFAGAKTFNDLLTIKNDLYFDVASLATIKTLDNSVSGATSSIYIGSGSNVGANVSGNTGLTNIFTGDITNPAAVGGTGGISIYTGLHSGAAGLTGPIYIGSGWSVNDDTGSVTITTGGISGPLASSGNLNLTTGQTINGDSGDIQLNPGAPSGTGIHGKIKLLSVANVGQVWTASASDASGSWQLPQSVIQTVSTNYTILNTDDIILAVATTPITLTLPNASGNSGKRLVIKKIDASLNSVTLSGTGLTTNKLMTPNETVEYLSNGSSWIQIRRDTSWSTTTTLTIAGSVSNPTKATTKLADKLTVVRQGKHLVHTFVYHHTNNAGATAGSGDYKFRIFNPSVWSIDTSLQDVSTTPRSNVGSGFIFSTPTGPVVGSCFAYDNISIFLEGTNDSGFYSATSTSSAAITSSTVIYSGTFTVPITNFED